MMYSMKPQDPLTSKELTHHLAAMHGAVEAAARMQQVLCLAETDSTNRVLLQMAAEGAPEGQVVLADCQTAGRGRLGRSFSSPAGYGLYFSYLFRTTPDPMLLTAHTAVAVSDAVEAVCGLRPQIKWVNDLLLPERADGQLKKNCGILAQAVTAEDGRVPGIVVGIGINVHEDTTDFPEELQGIACSLFTATGRHVARARLAAELITAMDGLRQPDAAKEAALLRQYRSHSLLPGKAITVIRGEHKKSAEALRIGDDFSLLVRYEDGSEERLRSGEVSVRMISR